MFLYFGSQKPERYDRSRQNYNYLVTACYCCLHYNSGNRFPDFPIGLNWGGVCRNRQQHCKYAKRTPSKLHFQGTGADSAAGD